MGLFRNRPAPPPSVCLFDVIIPSPQGETAISGNSRGAKEKNKHAIPEIDHLIFETWRSLLFFLTFKFYGRMHGFSLMTNINNPFVFQSSERIYWLLGAGGAEKIWWQERAGGDGWLNEWVNKWVDEDGCTQSIQLVLIWVKAVGWQ